jgi:hypothetical protein
MMKFMLQWLLELLQLLEQMRLGMGVPLELLPVGLLGLPGWTFQGQLHNLLTNKVNKCLKTLANVV